MLILFKLQHKTSILLLLFCTLNLYSRANEILFEKKTIEKSEEENLFQVCDTVLSDTNLNINLAPDSKLIEEISQQQIDFQVNSKIIYLNIKQFRNAEAKREFTRAWQKEREIKKISGETDSLRKVYALLPEDMKEEASRIILESEKKLMTLNEQVPDIYEKAREIENSSWLLASDEEILNFQEKLKLYRDSLTQAENLRERENETDQNIPDTIDFYQGKPGEKLKEENSSPVIYKIQIGSYKGKVPDSANKLITKLSLIRKIEKSKDEKGFTVYTTGNLKNFQEAVTMQNQVKQEGVKNAVITAYRQGKKISLEEAKKINKEQ